MKQQANQGASGMLLGMAAGAALGAVGVMAATQNQRQLVGDFVEKHMDS